MRTLFRRDRTFNWISTLLLAAWVILVTVAAESIGNERELQFPEVGSEVAHGLLDGATGMICSSGEPIPLRVGEPSASAAETPQALYLVTR